MGQEHEGTPEVHITGHRDSSSPRNLCKRLLTLTVSSEEPLIAAARSSAIMDLAVPGSPTNINARESTRVIRHRSTKARSPMNFYGISIRAGTSGGISALESSRSPSAPQMKLTTVAGVSFHTGGRAPLP